MLRQIDRDGPTSSDSYEEARDAARLVVADVDDDWVVGWIFSDDDPAPTRRGDVWRSTPVS